MPVPPVLAFSAFFLLTTPIKKCYIIAAVCSCNSDESRKSCKVRPDYLRVLRLLVLQRIVGRSRRCRLHKLQFQSDKDTSPHEGTRYSKVV